MPYYSKQDYAFKKFEKSKRKGKKYNAVLLNKKTKREVRVPFGGIYPDGKPYEQYEDSTGLGLYTNYNHRDEKRRENYRKRHKGFLKDGFYSASYFSYFYLW